VSPSSSVRFLTGDGERDGLFLSDLDDFVDLADFMERERERDRDLDFDCDASRFEEAPRFGERLGDAFLRSELLLLRLGLLLLLGETDVFLAGLFDGDTSDFFFLEETEALRGLRLRLRALGLRLWLLLLRALGLRL